MKQLQNNYTTPEQSKRLLELGVPADSADCYWNDYHHKAVIISHGGDVALVENGVFLPCWSVGRLQEICKICCVDKKYKQLKERVEYYKSTVSGWVTEIYYEASEGNIDFSKIGGMR